MPRIRALKHDFFMDEETAALPPDAQLLLLALSTLADRDGLLEDRPVRIKAQVFPYRDVDVDAHLNTLAEAGQVMRYEAAGKRCLFLVHFARDQKPHPKETSLNLPHPPEKVREISGQSQDASRRVPMVVGCGSGSGNGCGSSSLSASADEPEDLPDATEDAHPVTQPPLIAVEPEKPKGPDPEALRALWNRLAPPKGLQRWEAMSKGRAGRCRAALAAVPDVAKWEAWLTHELARPWNLGQNDTGWRADVDWFLRDKTRDLVADFNPATAPKPPEAPAPRKMMVL